MKIKSQNVYAFNLLKLHLLDFTQNQFCLLNLLSDLLDPEFRCLKAVLRRPTKLDYYAYQNHVNAVVNTATEMFQQSGSQRLLTFDLRGVFQLFVAGLDLVPR